MNEIVVEYIGFEPSPIEFSCLEQNVRPSVVHNVGLWNEEGELNFYISSQGADSSLIKPQEYNEIINDTDLPASTKTILTNHRNRIQETLNNVNMMEAAH